MELSTEQMLDLEQYPISDPGSTEFAALASRCRREYTTEGLCILPGFVNRSAQQVLADEANALSGHAYFCRDAHNAYLTDDDPEGAADDLRHKSQRTFVGSVAYDFLSPASGLNRLYNWDPLKDFIGAILGRENLHRSADPLGACSINVFVEGGEHGWHFDESEFTITLMLQPPQSGGAFEYVPRIRGRSDEAEIVRGLLNGDRSGVRELPFTPGALLVFGGRQTIHRVTRIGGRQPRLVPVFCYADEPGQINSDSVRQLFWGRTGAEAGQ